MAFKSTLLHSAAVRARYALAKQREILISISIRVSQATSGELVVESEASRPKALSTLPRVNTENVSLRGWK